MRFASRRREILMSPLGKYSIFLSNRLKKVTLGPLFRPKTDENRACVTQNCIFLV